MQQRHVDVHWRFHDREGNLASWKNLCLLDQHHLGFSVLPVGSGTLDCGCFAFINITPIHIQGHMWVKYTSIASIRYPPNRVPNLSLQHQLCEDAS